MMIIKGDKKMTCKQLTNKLQQLNQGLKIEVKKVTTNTRIIGKSTSYKLLVDGNKFYIGAFTLKQLVKDMTKNGNVLTLTSRYGKREQINVVVA